MRAFISFLLLLCALGCAGDRERRLYDEAILLDARGGAENYRQAQNIYFSLVREHPESRWADAAKYRLEKMGTIYTQAFEQELENKMADRMLESSQRLRESHSR